MFHCLLNRGTHDPARLANAMGRAMADAGLPEAAESRGFGPFAYGLSGSPASQALEEADVLLVADARIDARNDLLEKLGPDAPATGSDAALILAAWRKWGEDCPHHLLGDYAFVIYDRAADLLFCARDHVGARPLYFAHGPGWFALCGDPSGLLALPGIDDRLDEDVVLTRLSSRRFFPRDRGWQRGVRKLPGGHAMVLTAGGMRTWRCWRPGRRKAVRLRRPEDYASRLRVLVEAAVSDRLRDSRRIGLHLSGGLDSTTIAALAVPELRARKAAEPVGFSWHPGDPDAPPEAEPAWTEAIRAALGIELHAILPDAETILELLRRDCTRHPDPGNLMNELPVQRAAQQLGVDVILSGWGGDQGASYEGRGYRQGLLARGRWITLWRSFGKASLAGKLRRFVLTARALVGETLREGDGEKGNYASEALRRRAEILPLATVRKISAARTLADLFELGAIQSRLETWAASGARHGIEYRYPLLDRRVLEFAYSIPADMFLREGRERWLMRTAMDDILPETVKRHASKFEPVRVGHASDALLEALRRLRSEFSARKGAFERADFIDMDALEEWLEAQQTSVNGQARARIALQFLDFPEPGEEGRSDAKNK